MDSEIESDQPPKKKPSTESVVLLSDSKVIFYLEVHSIWLKRVKLYGNYTFLLATERGEPVLWATILYMKIMQEICTPKQFNRIVTTLFEKVVEKENHTKSCNDKRKG